MKFAQGVYPIFPDDDTAFAFVEFIHTRGSTILQATGGPGAPQVYVSLMEGARSHIVKTDSPTGVSTTGCPGSRPRESQALLSRIHNNSVRG